MARPAPGQWQSTKNRDPQDDETQAGRQPARAVREELRADRRPQQEQPSPAREFEDEHDFHDEHDVHDVRDERDEAVHWDAVDDHAPARPRAANDDIADVAAPPQGFAPERPEEAPRAREATYSFGYIVSLIVLALFAASVSAALVLIFL